MAIRGKSPAYIRRRLRSFFAAAGHDQPSWHLLLANGKTVPFQKILTGHGWATIQKKLHRGVPTLLRAKISNAKIRIKNNARVNYRDSKHGRFLSAKIALASRGRKESLAREIKAHRLLQRIAPDLPMPKIIGYDQRRLCWFIEEHIEGLGRSESRGGIEIFLRDVAEKLYRPSLRSQPATVWLTRQGISISGLWGILKEFNIVAEEDNSAPLGNWPIALLHGDLSPGNMIFGKDKNVYLVDWEKFGPGPVAWDLRKLIALAPALTERLLSALNGPEDMAPTRQIRLALAAELLRRRQARREIEQYLMSDLGKSAGNAQAIIAAREQELSRALASHFPNVPDKESVN
jgi:hypothetical protein